MNLDEIIKQRVKLILIENFKRTLLRKQHIRFYIETLSKEIYEEKSTKTISDFKNAIYLIERTFNTYYKHQYKGHFEAIQLVFKNDNY